MKIYNLAILTASLLFVTACGPKMNGEEDSDPTPAELLDDACTSFCDRALACPLGRYAELWSFQDEQTCVSQCLKFHADVPSDPPEMCLQIRADLWSCAGAIESCDLFDAFEDTTFSMPNALGNSCDSEFDEFIHKCNG